MRAVVVVVSALVVVVVAACPAPGEEGEGEEGEGEEGEGDGGDVVCGSLALVDGSTAPDDSGAIDVDGARLEDGEVIVNFPNSRTLIFGTSPSRPPLLPPAPSTQQIVSGREACFGEGCDFAWWTLSDDVGVPWFSVGVANNIDDGEFRGPAASDPISFRAASADERCGAGGGDGVAVAVVSGDAGDVVVPAGATRDVVIGGVDFAVAVSGALREVVTVEDVGPCADCVEPGDYVFTSAAAVLYRKAP